MSLATRESCKRLREKRKSKGLCTRCGKPAILATCEVCRENSRKVNSPKEVQRARAEKRKALGLCPRCGRVPTRPYKVCKVCRESILEYREGIRAYAEMARD